MRKGEAWNDVEPYSFRDFLRINSATSGKWSEAIRARGERCTATLTGCKAAFTKM